MRAGKQTSFRGIPAQALAPKPRQQDIQQLVALYSSGRLSQAEARARKLIKKFPGILGLYDILCAAQVGQGKLEDAAKSCRRALKVNPEHVGAHCNLGIIFRELGKVDESVSSCRKALSIDPGHAESRINLGVALSTMGKLEEAATCYRQALETKPDSASAHSNLGNALKDLGRLQEAVASHREAVRLMPQSPEVHNNLGNALHAFGRFDEAAVSFRQSLALRPDNADTQSNLGNALAKLGKFEEAASSFGQALRLNPDSPVALSSFAEALQNVRSMEGLADVRDLIVRCFESSFIASAMVRQASHTILKTDLRAFRDNEPYALHDLASLDPSTSGLLVSHLRHTLIADTESEIFLSGVRSAFLDLRTEGGHEAISEQAVLPLLEALACQGFLNEYVWHVTDEENASLDALEAEIANALQNGQAPRDCDLYLLAAYRPLYTLEHIRCWALEHHGDQGAGLRDFLKLVILDPETERELGRQIERLTSVEDDVSMAVRSQYEENPYPRWDSLSMLEPRPYTEHILRHIAPHSPALEAASQAPDVLIAGCGTGKHPIGSALGFQHSNVLAVDLSRTSLAFAKRKAEEFKVSNIAFAQADILKLGELKDAFDIVECSGVLHHMADPESGLKILLERLRPGGFLRLGLYSELARQNVVRLRQFVSEKAFEPTLSGIREFRHTMRQSGNLDAAALQQANDFYTASAIRDLIFHVQEHRFTIPRIGNLLDVHQLEFLGFVIEDPGVKSAYLARFPDDPDCLDLDNWHRFEQDNPATFVSMYQFWCRKGVRSA